MPANQNYPSYLPDDFKDLDYIQEGNQRYYYKEKDGKNLLIGSIVGKRHLVIRYPEGSTIDVVPPDSVGTEQIIDNSVQEEDLNTTVKDKLHNSYDSANEGIKLGGL